MAEPAPPHHNRNAPRPPAGPARSSDEIALELMKFIAVNTGYAKTASGGTGFSAKPGARSPEESADALIELFQRCRKAVKQE